MTLREISDREQIRTLLTRYCTAVDSRDYALLDSCFSKEARVDYSVLGGPVGEYAEFRRWLESSLRHLDVMQHSISNIVYEIDGDVASTRTIFTNPNVMTGPDGSELQFTVGGYYADELEYTSEGWKISHRTEELSYFSGERPSREALGPA